MSQNKNKLRNILFKKTRYYAHIVHTRTQRNMIKCLSTSKSISTRMNDFFHTSLFIYILYMFDSCLCQCKCKIRAKYRIVVIFFNANTCRLKHLLCEIHAFQQVIRQSRIYSRWKVNKTEMPWISAMKLWSVWSLFEKK